MAVNDEIQTIFDQEHLPQEVQDAINGQLADDAAKNDLIKAYNAFEPSTYKYNNTFDSVEDYLKRKKDDYGSGVGFSVTSLATAGMAKHNGDASFWDITLAKYAQGAKQDIINKALKEQDKPLLMLGNLETEDNQTHAFDGSLLEGLLKSPELAKFDRVAIPLSLYEKAADGKERRHTVSMLLDPKTKEAYLVDQGGKDIYPEYKEKIRQLMSAHSFKLDENEKQVMVNRMDCAIFASMVNDETLRMSMDEAKKHISDFTESSSEEFKTGRVDLHNFECKIRVSDAYADSYANDPLFQLYLKAKGIDFAALTDAAEKLKLIKAFAGGGVLDVDENLHDARPADPAWMEQVRESVKKANVELKQEFTETPNPEHPEQLFFKDAKNNTIAFASPSKSYVEGEQPAFDELCATAKHLGKDTINFGKFEEHPEYKARLYLACLKQGLKMKGNVPTEAELRTSGEYAEIQTITLPARREALRHKFRTLEADMSKAQEAFLTNKDCQDLMQKLKTAQIEAKETKNWDTVNQIKDDIKATPEGKTLNELVEAKATLFKEGISGGLINKKEVDRIGSRKPNETKFAQKEGESDSDFEARKAIVANYKPSKEKRFNTELTKQILKQAVGKIR